MNDRLKLFVTSPAGLESLVREELEHFGACDLRETVTGVFCRASVAQMYRICLWSRFANRVLLLLSEGPSRDRDALYQQALDIDWQQHFTANATFKVDFSGSNGSIRHSQFGAQVVKDAIVDKLQDSGFQRPNVVLNEPDLRVNVRLTKRACYLSLDLSGESLHKRGYRQGGGQAPIKENLAAAILARAGWPEIAKKGGCFVDPTCGSGTLLIEAVTMAANIPPSLSRRTWGFTSWAQHQTALWETIWEDAKASSRDKLATFNHAVFGCEIDETVYRQGQENLATAGLSEFVQFVCADFRNANFQAEGDGLILSNPPYGMRMGEADALPADYYALAQASKEKFPGWRLGILSSSPELLSETRLRYLKKYKIFNGPLACELRTYALKSEKEASAEGGELDEAVSMLVNRLEKNLRRLKPWLIKNAIDCYRVYDADIPEYSAAIDVYGDYLHIQEYSPPKTIEEQKAKQRFKQILFAAKHVFNADRSKVFTKTRRVNKGLTQYEKVGAVDKSDFFSVCEGKARFLVNLKSYLDTGLFLDHRPLRMRVADIALGKSFLNLFSYTATASVHAALGGASETVSVDMSNAYLAWSRMNFDENNIRSDKHQFIRADVTKWLFECRSGFDIIMLDPPSFSNSKKMDESFDVQRDHVKFVRRCMDLLKPGGVLFFSNNFRRFKLDEEISSSYQVNNITPQTIDEDFSRSPRIHHCFEIRHETV